MSDLTERMRQTSRGERCLICSFAGQVVVERADGTPLSEADRCPGCGRVVCDRHSLREGVRRDRRHTSAEHAERHVAVAEVRDAN